MPPFHRAAGVFRHPPANSFDVERGAERNHVRIDRHRTAERGPRAAKRDAEAGIVRVLACRLRVEAVRGEGEFAQRLVRHRLDRDAAEALKHGQGGLHPLLRGAARWERDGTRKQGCHTDQPQPQQIRWSSHVHECKHSLDKEYIAWTAPAEWIRRSRPAEKPAG
ncbi:hypothetical protein GCM10010885_03970 [Alicyclobacillus cellulosilyticus]|uniref:Uncharacterized protein n=1 Tax=Alicyclobacillus cellulosilyticus TaxID=1003997 RepID=A0A917NFL4_9BACL|nr:hypothetical protein GCM10010885_03970 [Alicyclobacillus cellulosilyticus]